MSSLKALYFLKINYFYWSNIDLLTVHILEIEAYIYVIRSDPPSKHLHQIYLFF